MAIPMTADFIFEKIKDGNSPVFLVEIQSAGRFFSTREPQFTGVWTAGDGLMAGSGIVANSSYPTYDGGLSQIVDGGVGPMSQTLDFASGLALTGQSSVSILNQTLFSHLTDDVDLDNARIRVRLGFFGQEYSDYITIFSGAIDDYASTLQTMELSLVDDSIVGLKPTPPKTGSDFLPQAFDENKTIPIILGDVDLVPSSRLISSVSATLLTQLQALDDSMVVTPVSSKFPPVGTVDVVDTVTEEIQYDGVELTVVGQQQGLRLLNLTRTAPAFHAAGLDVTLDLSAPTLSLPTFLLGFQAQSVRRIRRANGTSPTDPVVVKSAPLDPNGNDPRRITILEANNVDDDLTMTVEGDGRAPNLIVNGEGDADPLAVGWSLSNGSWATTTALNENVIRGRVNIGQVVDSEILQDVSTVDGELYRLTGSVTLVSGAAPPFATIRIGDPGAPSSVFDFGQITDTTERGVDLTFRAPAGGLTRITLVVNSSTPGAPEDAYFDHIVLYKLDSENPATQIERLITKHIPGIVPDTTSFAAATAKFNENGDRMAGVLDTTQEAQPLLGRLAFQYRSKTFLDEAGRQKLVVFDNAAPAIATVFPSDIDKGTFRVTKEPEEKVYNRFYVYFNRRADVNQGNLGGREAYQNVLFATPEETNSIEDAALQVLCQQARDKFRIDRPLEIFADMIPDAATADRLLSHVVRIHTHTRILAEFTTYINHVEFEVADVIRINHPLLPDSANNVTFEVIEKEILPNGCQVAYTCAEIRQSQFNSFIENWDAPFLLTPSPIIFERWETPTPVATAILDGDGNVLRCNPFLEDWEAFVTSRDEDFKFAASQSGIGTDPIPLTRAHVDAYDTLTDPAGFVESSTNTGVAQGGFVATAFTSGTFGGMIEPFDHLNIDNPAFLATGGPSGGTAFDFANDGIGTNQGVITRQVKQVFRDNSGFLEGRAITTGEALLRPQHSSIAFSLWVNMDIKATANNVHRPIMTLRNSPRLSLNNPNPENVHLVLYWDTTADRFVVAWDNKLADIQAIDDYNTFIAALGNKLTATTFGAPSIGTWHFLVFSYDKDAATISIGVDGGAYDTLAVPAFSMTDPAEDVAHYFYIGTSARHRQHGAQFGSGFDGKMSNFHFWARPLSNAESVTLYNSGAPLVYPYTTP